MANTRFHLVSLGCAKNTVDSESMSTLLGRAGFRGCERPEDAEFLIVNTCGFIGPAKEESLAVLRELAQGKREGQLLIAAGCLTQRYGLTVVELVPGIDGVLGTRRWMDIVQVVQSLRERRHPEPLYHLPETPAVGKEEQGVNRVAVSGASAYLKIADGCRRPCAFCAIPLIKGPAVSRPMEAILGDARQLQEAGVREVILIAQDTTDYGHDLGVKDGLAKLLEDLVKAIPDVDWIRVMYAYPGYVTDHLIEVMAENKQVLPYLDMPLQHADQNILRDMRRPANVDWVQRTIEKMRGAMPELALRTTFIVGYPGETEKVFGRLLDFIREIRFDRVGVFSYSPESGTAGEPLGDPILLAVKEERRDRLMGLQQRISLERNQSFLGETLPVLIEGCGDGISLGRSYRDAPEIDGMVIVEEEIPAGEMVQVCITGALEYDLSGVIAGGAAASS
jgi:ribosomal protein S12 methylthiotransferase